MKFLVNVCHILFYNFLVFVTQINGNASNGDVNSVVGIHVIFRHGDRTPEKNALCPNDPRINNTFEENGGYGQLTIEGKKREYNIGLKLRERYPYLAETSCKIDRISGLSTNYTRTQMSLQLVFAGLCPPKNYEKIADKLNWQPFPYSVKDGQRIIGLPILYCSSFQKLYADQLKSEKILKIIAANKKQYEQLSIECGKKLETPHDMLLLHSTMEDGSKPFIRENVSLVGNLAAKEYIIATSTPLLKKLSAGFMLKYILKDSFSKQTNSEHSKINIHLYSGHEYSIGTMLCTLNVFDNCVPPYGATIIFELHKINKIFGIKLFYINYKQEEPKVLIIPGCQELCPLETLFKLLEDSLPNDTDSCDLHEERSLATSLRLSLLLFVLSNITMYFNINI